MKTLLIGADGLLGSFWQKKLPELCPGSIVRGTTRRSLSGSDYFFLDLLSGRIEDFKDILSNFNPDAVVYLAGVTNVDECEKSKELALELNTKVPARLAEVCSQEKVKYLYISTDHLFDDGGKYFTEESETKLVNYYAYSKKLAEDLILKNNPLALIVRTNFYGKSIATKPSFTDWIEQNLKNGVDFKMATDVFFNPVYMEDLIKISHQLLEKNLFGIFNVSSDERISKYDFAKLYARTFNLNDKLIIPFEQKKEPKKVKRPSEMSLSNNKIKSVISIPIGKTQEGFNKLKSENERSSVMIHYGKQSIDTADIEAVVEVLKGNFLTQGPYIDQFEKSICDLTGAKYAVAIMNWTAGIHIACEAAGLNSKNTLVTSPLTFCASSNGALYCGSTPLFADIDPVTLNMDPKMLDEVCKKNGNVRVIMPVHFGGLACDMEEINRIAKKYGAVVVEDAAHAIGGKYADGSLIGNCKYSEMVGFSFHPVKNIACGEGGMITTNNEGVYRKLLRLRSHGINKLDDQLISEEAFTDGIRNQWYHEMQILGYNYRMTDIQAALGNSQLKKLDTFLKRRILIAERYEAELQGCENLKIPQQGLRKQSGNHLFVLRVNFEQLGKNRNQVIEELKHHGVQGHVHYLPVPMMPYYRENYPSKIEDYAEALAYYREALTIPLYPAMSDIDVAKVISAVKKVIG